MILVTGGAGFIGSNLVRFLVEDCGERVVVLDSLTYAGNPANLDPIDGDRFTLVRGDIRDRALVRDLLDRSRPRAVLHLAAESHVDRSIDSAGDFVSTNINGTFELLEAVRGFWGTLAEGSEKDDFRFVHVSTDEVYGALGPDDASFTEDSPHRPNSPYSASKAASDHLARAWHRTYGLPVVITNCSNNYGPYQFPEKLIPLMISNALEGKHLPIYGDGMQVRDWLYVEDHCRGIAAALAKGVPGETYIIGGGAEMPNIELVRTLCNLLDERRPKADGGSYASQIAHVEDRAGHDRRYSVDCTKARAELGYEAHESFESGLKKTVDWYLGNAEWLASVQSGEYRDWIAKQYGEMA